MALNLQSLSITQSINSIISFFKSQENNSKWKDLTSGSEGLFLIRLLGNVITNISYRLVSARRENYLSTANLLSSNIGIAVNLGYSVYRGSNQKRRVQLLPNENYTIPKYSVVGKYDDDYDIITLEDLNLVKNVKKEFKTVIGKVKEISFITGTSDVKIFSQYVEGISEDYVLYLGTTEVPTSDVIKDLVYDKYLVRTNPYNSIDIIYLNNAKDAQYTYGEDTEFTIKYVELAEVPTILYTDDMFSYGTLLNTVTIANYVPFETVDEIKVNAPIDHETQNIIRSKKDYANRAKQIIANIKETNYKAITPTYTLISYLKDDYTTITEVEEQELNDLLEDENYFGTPVPDIVTPKREQANLNISLRITDKFKDINEINEDIANILQTNYDILMNQTFDVYVLERLLENSLAYVKFARVEYDVEERKNTSLVQLGTVVKIDTNYYRATSVLGTTGTSEPAWQLPVETPTSINTNLTTQDENVIWQAYKRLPNMGENLTEWKSTTTYKLGDYVYTSKFPNYMFKCVDLVKYSGEITPDVSEAKIGDFILDGKLVWVVKNYNASYQTRLNNTNYKLGESVNVEQTSLECISYLGYTSSTLGTFEKYSYPIESVTLDSFVLSGNLVQFFKVDDVIKAKATGNTFIFSVTNVVYNQTNNKTLVTVAQTIDTSRNYSEIVAKSRGTKDGELFWTVIQDISSMTYDWNTYNTFKANIEII